MSLFTNADDRNLPFLTQFYQLDPDNEAELRDWTAQALERKAYLYYGSLVIIHDDEETRYRELNEKFLPTMRALHTLTRMVMDSLADKNSVYRLCLYTLRRTLPQLDHDSLINLKVPTDPLDFVAAEDVSKAFPVRVPEYHLLLDMAQELNKLCEDPVRVLRCAKCKSAYVPKVVRGNNRFCSRRCSNRFHVAESRKS
jgi:hypothetical protein